MRCRYRNRSYLRLHLQEFCQGNFRHADSLCYSDLCGTEFLGTSLLRMYMNSQRLADANILFWVFTNLKSTVRWTTLISGHTQNECSDVPLNLYWEMHDNIWLRAGALLSSFHDGREINSLTFRSGLNLD